jgi:6-pyruvoyltetrahydropterin/6-carboxytetrahydropterin synthase
MYTVAVKRDFIAQHFLIGGDWGAENFKHSHHYSLELQLKGSELDPHGYLVDIVEIEHHLSDCVSRYCEKTLNDLPEFAGLNPSIEHFTRILAERFSQNILAANIQVITVILWENEIAWASYELSR